MIKIIKIILTTFFILNLTSTFSFSKNNSLQMGSEDAKITVKVFSSLTCPHCADFHKNIFKNLKREYIDTNKVRFEHHSFPLDLAALNAEKILRCGLDMDLNFKLLEEIYNKQSVWAVGPDIDKINKSIIEIGLNLNLIKTEMDKCLQNDEIQDQILNDRIKAQKKYKISSTPTVLINEKKYEGKHDFETFKVQIEKLL